MVAPSEPGASAWDVLVKPADTPHAKLAEALRHVAARIECERPSLRRCLDAVIGTLAQFVVDNTVEDPEGKDRECP